MMKKILFLIMIIFVVGCKSKEINIEKQKETKEVATVETAVETTEISTETTIETKKTINKKIVIDPGHQEKGNNEKEEIAPGSTELKNKVSSGTRGVSTGLYEYQLNLDVSLKIYELLKENGFDVVMTRYENNVNISNKERAEFANNENADIFIRIHANGSEDSLKEGVMTICQTENNPYNKECFEESYRLSNLILEKVVSKTGAKKEYVWKTDTMTGINHAKIPSTILEMGYMSNALEDAKLSDDTYQNFIAEGVLDAVLEYFKKDLTE